MECLIGPITTHHPLAGESTTVAGGTRLGHHIMVALVRRHACLLYVVCVSVAHRFAMHDAMGILVV